MIPSEIFVAVLLGTGVLGFALTALGLLLKKSAYDQVHYLAPGSLLGSAAFAAAVVVHEGMDQAGAKVILIAVILLISNPVLSHATVRACRIRRNQQVMPLPGEEVPLAKEAK